MSDTKKRTYRVWAIMRKDSLEWVAVEESREEAEQHHDLQYGERVVAATLTLSPPPRRKPSKRSPR